MKYADIILPLGIEGKYTYSVPTGMEQSLVPFLRVRVPLGKSKTYVGIVCRIHTEQPQGVEVKPILDILDKQPILLPYQYRMWEWIADYYLSPIGDVYRAAFPAGMKQEERYKPKTETFIRLTPQYQNEASLHIAMNMLQRATKQLHAFTTYLFLSHYDETQGNNIPSIINEITRDELINSARCTTAVVKSLVDRGFLETYDVNIGRLNTTGQPHPERIKPLSNAQQKAYEAIAAPPPPKGDEAPPPPKGGVCKNGSATPNRNTYLNTPPLGGGGAVAVAKPSLLHGVTGSGKTEIYIHLIQQHIDRGEQVLYLLPEIALTVQIMKRLHDIFGNRLGIYHSRYSDEERVEIWQKQLSDQPYDIILGARSAVFLPFQRLGLVIIDEEHESSFKQQDPAPRYHARSVAMMLPHFMADAHGKQRNIDIILGTATPSLETYYNATVPQKHSNGTQTTKYKYVALTERYKGVQLPSIEIVDIADLQRRKMMQGPFSPQLLEAMRSAIDEGHQVILFQNRRGFAPMVECHDCGYVPKCKNCDVSLTMHKVTNQLTCHYCGYTYAIPAKCPECGCTDLRQRGYGTEKIEELLAAPPLKGEAAPPPPKGGVSKNDSNADNPNSNTYLNTPPLGGGGPVGGGAWAISRMDLDTTRSKNAYERIIDEFSSGKTNILIGTQMVTKGLDFGNVTVVGILNADTMLNYPDFRSYEQAFQMLCQVSGRAGRRPLPSADGKSTAGRVILQTKHPDHPIIHQVQTNDYPTFFADQCAERELFHYPPFSRIIYVYLRHAKEPVVDTAAIEMGARLRQLFGKRILGPDRPAVSRIKAQSIRKIIIKLESGIDLPRVRLYLRTVRQELLKDKRYVSLQIYYDVDPL